MGLAGWSTLSQNHESFAELRGTWWCQWAHNAASEAFIPTNLGLE